MDDPREKDARRRPLRAPIFMPEPIPTTPRGDRTPAAGRQEIISGASTTQGAMEVARIQQEETEEFTITIDVIVEPGNNLNPVTPSFVWAIITIGSGSNNVQHTVKVADHIDVPVVANFVQVQLFIGDTNANPQSAAIVTQSATVITSVARGIRGLPYVCPLFANASTASGPETVNLIQGPAMVLSVRGHLIQPGLTSAGPYFLQLYDCPRSSAAAPNNFVCEFTLDPAAKTETQWRFLNPRGFGFGVTAFISKTSGSTGVSFPADTDAWVEVETQAL